MRYTHTIDLWVIQTRKIALPWLFNFDNFTTKIAEHQGCKSTRQESSKIEYPNTFQWWQVIQCVWKFQFLLFVFRSGDFGQEFLNRLHRRVPAEEEIKEAVQYQTHLGGLLSKDWRSETSHGWREVHRRLEGSWRALWPDTPRSMTCTRHCKESVVALLV